MYPTVSKLLSVLMCAVCIFASSLIVAAVRYSESDVVLEALAYIKNSTHQLSIDEIQTNTTLPWVPFENNLSLGYTRDPVWVAIDLQVTGDIPQLVWLDIIPSFLDWVDVYYQTPDAAWQHLTGGDQLPLYGRLEPYRATAFPLNLPPGPSRIFLRLQTTGMLALGVSAMTSKQFRDGSRSSYLGFGFYFGLLLTVALINTLNGVHSKEPVYLVYVAYIVLVGFQLANTYGFTGQYFFPDQPRLNNALLGVSIALAGAAAWVFFVMVLGIREHHPLIYKLAQLGVAFSLLTALSVPLGFYPEMAPWFLLLAMVAIASAPWPATRLWRTGDLWARIVVTSYLIYCALVAVNIASSLGLLAYTETTAKAGMASTLTHVLLLHLAILLRNSKLQQDAERLRTEVAHSQMEAEFERRISGERAGFLSLMAHEVRTPVAVIGSAHQVLELLDGEQTDSALKERKGRYRSIKQAVNRLSLLLGVALDRERLDPVDWQQQLVEQTIAKVIEALLNTLELGTLQRLSIKNAVPDLVVRVDTAMLQLALVNLLENAAKYSPNGLPIELQVCQRTLLDRDGVEFSIRDHGTGIPADLESKIFDRYHRGTRAAAAKGKAYAELGLLTQGGLGLGLYLVQKIVEQHDGLIMAENWHEGGAIFRVWLPSVGVGRLDRDDDTHSTD